MGTQLCSSDPRNSDGATWSLRRAVRGTLQGTVPTKEGTRCPRRKFRQEEVQAGGREAGPAQGLPATLRSLVPACPLRSPWRGLR